MSGQYQGNTSQLANDRSVLPAGAEHGSEGSAASEDGDGGAGDGVQQQAEGLQHLNMGIYRYCRHRCVDTDV